MSTADRISIEDLRELLNKGWMTHDAMWFYHCVQEVGIEKTNKINRAAVRSMAMIEVKRMKKFIGLEKVESYDDLQRLFQDGFEVIKPDFMKFSCTFPGDNIVRWETEQCFAYDGVKGLGLIDQYECGIIDRTYGWLDGLDLQYSVTPELNGCLLHSDGKCVREMKVEI